MNATEFIRNCPPFDRLNAAELTLVVNDAELININAGTQVLNRNGAPSEYMYLIESGSVSLAVDGDVVEMPRAVILPEL